MSLQKHLSSLFTMIGKRLQFVGRWHCRVNAWVTALDPKHGFAELGLQANDQLMRLLNSNMNTQKCAGTYIRIHTQS